MGSSRDSHDHEDDEPQSKRRKKKGKKKSGLPVMLFVLIGVGALLLLGGGGVGAYFAFFNEEETKPSTQAKGGATTGAPAPKTPALAANWFEQYEPDGRYRIKFPSQPRSLSQKHDTPRGQIEVKMYMAGSESEGLGSLHFPIPTDRGDQTDEQVVNQAADLLKAQFRGAVPQGTKPVSYLGFSGRDDTMIPPDKRGLMIVRFLLAGDRLIMLIAGGDNITADSPRVKAFFESLKIE
jgi:hypothetical protein